VRVDFRCHYALREIALVEESLELSGTEDRSNLDTPFAPMQQVHAVEVFPDDGVETLHVATGVLDSTG
jgi:hypothetical protein